MYKTWLFCSYGSDFNPSLFNQYSLVLSGAQNFFKIGPPISPPPYTNCIWIFFRCTPPRTSFLYTTRNMVDWMKYVLKGEIGVGLLLQKVNINKGGMLSGRMGAFKKVLSMEGNPVIPLQKTHQ